MNDSREIEATPRHANPYVVAALALFVYFGLPEYRQVSVPTPQWFPQLAQAFLDGRLTIKAEGNIDELIRTEEAGRYFVAYPPLPAIVAAPFVALLGDLITSSGMCRLLMAVAVLLFSVVVRRAAMHMHGRTLSPRDHYLLVAFFAFGTAVWESAARAGDWHFAHACAVCAMLLALIEFFGRRRAFIIGAAVGLALLARPTSLFVSLFFLLSPDARRSFKSVALLAVGPVVAIGLLCVYNAARFGTPFDFHYASMIVSPGQDELMRPYGQFNLAFLPRNVFWFFLAPPSIRADGFPWLAYDPRGMSLLLTSPAIVYAFIGALRSERKKLARAALIGCAVCLIPLLLYFNTGFWQFGHRFGLDYLPVLMVAVIVGMGPSLSKLARGLLIASIVIHVWGIVICGMDGIAALPVWMVVGG